MIFFNKRIFKRFAAGLVFSALLLSTEGFFFTGEIGATENQSVFDEAEHWNISNLDGETLEFGQFRGKIIFINIWATWCMPCIVEMKSIQDLYNTFKDEDVVFIIVSDEKTKTVQEFVEKNRYTFPVYLTDRGLPSAFKSIGIPATFIINREGKMVLNHIGSVDWNQQSSHEFIRDLLAGKQGNSDFVNPQLSSDIDENEPVIVREQRLEAMKTFIASRLEPFIEQNDLPPDVKTKLIDLCLEEQNQMNSLGRGNTPIQERINQINKMRSDFDEKFSQLLSEDQYAAYREYKRFENEWITVSQIQKELKYYNIKLEKEQEEQLVAAMYNDRQEIIERQRTKVLQRGFEVQSQEDMMKQSLEYQQTISGIYIDSAKGILSEEQFRIFKRYFDYQTYITEKSLINRSR